MYIIAGDSDPSPLNPTAHDSVSPYADWLEAAVAHGAIYLDEPEAQVRGKSTLWLVPEYLYSLDLDSTEAAYQAQHDALSQPDVILSPDQAAQLRVADYQLAKLASIREKLQTIKDEDIQVAVSHTPLTRDYVTTMMARTEKTQHLLLPPCFADSRGPLLRRTMAAARRRCALLPGLRLVPGGSADHRAGLPERYPPIHQPRTGRKPLLFLPARSALQQSRHDLPTANQPYQLNNGQKETAPPMRNTRHYEMDMCSGPLLPKILRFTLPLILTGVLQLLYNACGRGSGRPVRRPAGAGRRGLHRRIDQPDYQRIHGPWRGRKRCHCPGLRRKRSPRRASGRAYRHCRGGASAAC